MKSVIGSFIIVYLLIQSHFIFAQCLGLNDIQEGPIEDSWAVVEDDQQNIYTCGVFNDSARFDTVLLTNPNHASTIFLNKYDPQGHLILSRSYASSGSFDFSPRLAYYADTIYMLGALKNGILELDTGLVDASANKKLFLAALTANGQLIWLKQYSSTKSVQGLGLYVDDKFIYIAGRFNGIFDFGQNSFQSPQKLHAYIGKLNHSGNLLWMREGKSTRGRAWSIISDHNYNVLVGGYYYDSITYDGVHVIKSIVQALDAYVAKFDSDGNCLWITGQTDGLGFATFYSIAVDSSNNIYATTPIGYSAFINNTWYYGDTVGYVLLCKLDENGNFQWVHPFGTITYNFSGSIAWATSVIVDNSNNIWAVGQAIWEITIDSIFYKGHLNSSDWFALKYDENANLLEYHFLGGRGQEITYGATLSDGYNPLIVGYTSSDTIYSDTDTIEAPGTNGSKRFILWKICSKPVVGLHSNIDTKHELTAFPNPASGDISISFTGFENKPYVLRLFNSAGQPVLMKDIQISVENQTTILKTNALESGLYFIHVTDGDQSFTCPVVIVH